MGHGGPRSKPIFLDDMVYEGWISFQFTFVHKGIFVSMKGCIGISEWYLKTELID